MRLPQRLRVVIPGGAAVALAGVLGAWSSVTSFLTTSMKESVVAYVAAVLLAPLVLLFGSLSSVAGGPIHAPASLRVVAVIALAASPVHAAIPRRRTAILSIAGLVAWFLCELILVGAPA